MMNGGTNSGRGRWQGPPQRAGVLAITAGFVLLAAACGGSPSSTGSSGSDAGGSTNSQLLAFAQCVRSHGVPNFPDPSSSGEFSGLTPQQLGISSSRLQAVENACRHLLPNGSGNKAQNVSQFLQIAQCMRSHGVPNYPDPDPHATISMSTEFAQLGINPHSPQFQTAARTCNRLYPLPSASPQGGGS
jgi:hypothetical protein